MSLGFESTGTAVAAEGDLLEPPAPAAGDKRHGRSPSRIAFDRLRHDKVAIVCFGIVVFFVLVAIFAPLLCKLEGQTPTAFNQDLIAEDTLPLIGPTSDHWFGIEPRLGRDLFARWVYGARPSLRRPEAELRAESAVLLRRYILIRQRQFHGILVTLWQRR